VVFPIDYRHIIVFDADSSSDEVRAADDNYLPNRFAAYFPEAPRSLRSVRQWQVTMAWISMGKELYARTPEDVSATARVVEPSTVITLATTPSAGRRGVAAELTRSPFCDRFSRLQRGDTPR
jgi:hypothetical protein